MAQYDIRSQDSGIAIVGKLLNPAGDIVSASGATSINFALFKPDSSYVLKTGEVYWDSADSIYKTRFFLTGNETNMIGDYRIQVQLTLPSSGVIASTNEGILRVARKIGT